VRKRNEWSDGPSDIEGKTTRVGASERGQRTSFNRTREAGNRDEVEGVAANTLNLFRNGASLLANGAAGDVSDIDGQTEKVETSGSECVKTFGVGFID
jgi:hypothetical protein